MPIVGRTADSITIEVPDEATFAPPGWYMLFLTDEEGLPSRAAPTHVV